MRTKSLIFLLLTVFSSVAYGEEKDSLWALSDDQVAQLNEPVYTKQFLRTRHGKILVVTKDYGFGAAIRTVYVYVKDDGGDWEALVYRQTITSKITATLVDNEVRLVSKAGKLLLSIPVQSLFFEYDPKE